MATEHLTRITNLLLELTEAHYYAGRMTEALAILDAGVHLLEVPGARKRDLARLLVQHGKLLSLENLTREGDFDATLDVLERARQIAVAIGDVQIQADALDLVGMTRYYRSMARRSGFEESNEYFDAALALRERIGDRRGVAETVFHIGLIEQNTGQWERAGQTFQRAFTLAQDADAALEASYAIRHLGFVHQHPGDQVEARGCLARSLSLRQEIGFRLFLPYSHLALGDVEQELGDLDAAEEQFSQALAIAEVIGSTSQHVFSLIALADLHMVRGAVELARGELERAWQLATDAGFSRGLVQAEHRLAALSDNRPAGQ